MRRIRRGWTLASWLALLAIVPEARAGFPPGYPNSTTPSVIALVGSTGGAPASDVGAFVVTVRDIANNPVPGVLVVIDLSSTTDVTLCSDQLNPSLTLSCSGHTVGTMTDGAGRAFFTLVGQGNSTGARTLSGFAGRIYADGFFIAGVTVAAYDADGANGLSPNDLSNFIADFASGQPYGRSDYDGSGSLGAHDLTLWLTAFAQGTQTASCASGCP